MNPSLSREALFERSVRRLIQSAIVCAALISPSRVVAQDLRGIVVQSDSVTPASGTVVLLMHVSKDSSYSRVVTGERGTFTFRVPASTPVRLRVLRLGFEATNTGAYNVAAGQVGNVRITLGEKRIMLATLNVQTANRCDIRPDAAQLVAQLYEEARKALLLSASPVSNVRHQAQFTMFTRAQDTRGKLVAPIQRNAFAGVSSRPFASLPADSLAKVGYVTEEKDGTSYRAPDADVLLAESFLATHCLQFVQGTGDRAAYVGIGFKPVNRPRGRIDVKGTLWLDRETSELQFLEYAYEGVPETFEKANVGGRVDYTQMAAGLWFVNKWAIRMPRFEARSVQEIAGMRGGTYNAVDLAGLQIIGGEVNSVRIDDELLYNNSGAALVGSEPRDWTDAKVLEGSFDVAASAEQVANVQSANALPVSAIDSVFSTSRCTDAMDKGYTGQVQGRVRDVDNKGAVSLVVAAEWKEDFKVGSQKDFSWQYRRLETKADAKGEYSLCGLPVSRVVSLTALNGDRKSRVSTIRVTDKSPRTSMDISIGANIGSTVTVADLKGRGALLDVKTLSGQPIAHAVVAIGGGATRIADEDGRIVLTQAPRDSLRVLGRRIGYAAFEGKIGRDPAGIFQLVLLPAAQQLKTVTVTNDSRDILARTGFYERAAMVQRGAVTGDFITPEMIDARESGRVADFIRGSRYVRIPTFTNRNKGLYGRNNCLMNVILDGKREISLETFESVYKPPEGQSGPGIAIDRSKVGGGWNIDDLVAGNNVVAVEIYPSSASAPVAISSLVGSDRCGIIAIWTGRR